MRRTESTLFCVLTCMLTPLLSPMKGQAPPSNGETRIVAGRIQDRVLKGRPAPAPRFPGGKPDLGNGKGSWNPRIIENIAGVGPGEPGRNPVEKVIDVPFQPWARQLLTKCVLCGSAKGRPRIALPSPPGIPRLSPDPLSLSGSSSLRTACSSYSKVARTSGEPFLRDGRPHRERSQSEGAISAIQSAIGRKRRTGGGYDWVQ